MAFNSIWGGVARASSSFSVSMESFGLEDDIVNPVTGDVVDDVDTEIAEMATESAELEAGFAEVQRATTAADIGETVAEAAQAVQDRGDVSPEEAALIQAGAAQTLNGIGAPSSDIVEGAQEVASESAGVYTVATEGYMEKLKSAWQAIKDFVLGLIRKAKDFINRLWNSTAGVLKKVKKVEEVLKNKSEEKSEENIEKWYGYFTQLSETSSGKFKPESITAEFKKYNTRVEKITGDVEDAITAMAGQAKNVKAAFDFNAIATKLGTADVSKYLGKGFAGSVEELPLGNKVYVAGYNKNTDISLVARLNSIAHRVVDASGEFKPKPKEVKFSVFTHAQITSLLDEVKAVIGKLEKWYNTGSKEAYKRIDTLQSEIDKAAKEAKDDASPAEKENMTAYQRCFVAAAQSVGGAISLCTHVIKTSNAAVALAATMAGKYKNKEK